MREGRASHTAEFITFIRAMGNLSPRVRGFSDPFAERLLSRRWAAKVARARERLPKDTMSRFFRGMRAFNQFRTSVLDQAIVSAASFEQLVILGAGLDTRAWRLRELAQTTAFEVDFPSTQGLKKERIASLPTPVAREVRFVPVDFTKDELAARLADAGFKRELKSFWLWEGVTMYLTPAQVERNLRAIAALSAPGSRLALTYMGKTPPTLRKKTMLWLFGLMTGEPMQSAFSVDELDTLARSTGWSGVSNTGIQDWLPSLAPDMALTKKQVGMQWDERIWVGSKS